MFCPRCHAEYRPGFTDCAHCEVPLVETLEVEVLSPERVEDTTQVGLVKEGDKGQPIEVGGKHYDLMRVFPLDFAISLRDLLTADGFAVLLVPVDEDFPDQRPRFEVRVLDEHAEAAQAHLESWWKEQVDKQEEAARGQADSVEQCPACGAHVPLDAEECPECGLFVGAGEEDEGDEDEAEGEA